MVDGDFLHVYCQNNENNKSTMFAKTENLRQCTSYSDVPTFAEKEHKTKRHCTISMRQAAPLLTDQRFWSLVNNTSPTNYRLTTYYRRLLITVTTTTVGYYSRL